MARMQCYPSARPQTAKPHWSDGKKDTAAQVKGYCLNNLIFLAPQRLKVHQSLPLAHMLAVALF